MLLLSSLALLALGQKSKPPTHVRYFNARFGYAVDVPSSLVLKREADNGDGRAYLSKDARSELLVYGSHTLLDDRGEAGESLAGGYRRWLAQASKRGGSAKFSSLGSKAFSVSWRDGRRLIYVRTIQLPDGFATVEFTYPIDRKPAVEAAVRKTIDSLVPVRR